LYDIFQLWKRVSENLQDYTEIDYRRGAVSSRGIEVEPLAGAEDGLGGDGAEDQELVERCESRRENSLL
jgi:hypothetical protein